MIEKIKQFLDQLNERERRVVIAAAIALALFIPYEFIWSPFVHGLNTMQERVEQEQKDLAWMQEHVSEARELTRSTGQTGGGAQPVYGVIESTARQRFGGDIRVQQEGKGGVRVTINNIGYDDVLLWLDDLYNQHHINVKEFTVDRQPTPGRVNANILIEG